MSRDRVGQAARSARRACNLLEEVMGTYARSSIRKIMSVLTMVCIDFDSFADHRSRPTTSSGAREDAHPAQRSSISETSSRHSPPDAVSDGHGRLVSQGAHPTATPMSSVRPSSQSGVRSIVPPHLPPVGSIWGLTKDPVSPSFSTSAPAPAPLSTSSGRSMPPEHRSNRPELAYEGQDVDVSFVE